MQPIAFWIVGVISLLAALMAVGARRPAFSAKAFIVVLLCSSIAFLLLEAPLLASEILLVCVGGGFLVWLVTIRHRLLRLGPPGRARLNVTRLVGFFIALWLGGLLIWALLQLPVGVIGTPTDQLEAGFGFWSAVVLIGTAVVTSWLVIANRRRETAVEDES
jgi:NADH:ubiquinone oxidoreductase subunit 6 (subunit J)